VTATSVIDATKSASATVTIAPVMGTTYYLATAAGGGNDANDGLSAVSPWLTPYHPVACGDTILAAPSSAYDSWNFNTGHWGQVTCSGGNSVAWLKCAVFDACKVMTPNGAGMWVDQSYWGVQGWEVTSTASYGPCFVAQPNYVSPAEIHHIVFANNVANGCTQGGITTNTQGGVAVDYVAIVGNIAYNGAQGSSGCTSGISVYEPKASDALAGTHLYVAGNFSWSNLNPSVCNYGPPTDGDGVILDTLQQYGYNQQVVVTNNLVLNNGGKGILVALNASAPVFVTNNTVYGNERDPNSNYSDCAELQLYQARLTQATGNLFATSSATGCGSNAIYAMAVLSSDATDMVSGNFAYSAAAQTMVALSSGGFAFGANVTGTAPAFASAAIPGAPNCSAASSVANCMAATVANFAPAAAAGYGVQAVSATPIYDVLFPQWLCNVSLPAGLVSLGCRVAP
jgi:hypothetical protein